MCFKIDIKVNVYDRYLVTVIRYIHNNPVKAGMVKKAEEYKWSSECTYYDGKEYPAGLTDTDFVLGMFSEDKKTAIKKFRQFIKKRMTISVLKMKYV